MSLQPIQINIGLRHHPRQKERGSFYGASKTLAEKAAYDFVAKEMPSCWVLEQGGWLWVWPAADANVKTTKNHVGVSTDIRGPGGMIWMPDGSC